jgi:flagellin
MSLFVQTNIASMNAQDAFAANEIALNKTYQQLSTGYKINSAGDDAAGLGIAKRMSAQVDSYTEAQSNANDAISMTQTADGGAEQISDILDRMRQLAVEGSNGTMSASDSSNLNTEFQAQLTEINQIADTTNFNGINVLQSPAAAISFQVGINTTDANNADTIAVTFGGVDVAGLALTGAAVDNQTDAQTAIGTIDKAIDSLSTIRAGFGAAEDQFQYVVSNLQSISTNTSAALSQFQDVDVASATATLAQDQVLTQAGETVLAQANQTPQLAEALIRGQ